MRAMIRLVRESAIEPKGFSVAHSLLHHNGPPLTDLKPVMMDPRKLAALGEETRGHPPKQIRKICRSLRAFGFVYPVLVDDNSRVIGGSALVVAVRISHKRGGGVRVGAPLARITVALLRGRRNRARIASSTHSLRAGSLGADQSEPGRGVSVIPTARCQIIPGSWVSNAPDNLSDRFGHQLWFVLMDVVAALSGDEEARVRDKLRQIFVGRVQY